MAVLATGGETTPSSMRWLGIDFSGDHRKWGASNPKSNVYIAEVRHDEGGPLLSSLQTPQELPGHDLPFQRLVSLLKAKDFRAAAIDAPFSVPREYLPEGSHQKLLSLVGKIERPKGWPFPAAQDFVCRILSGRNLSNKKPLRKTEQAWTKKLNVRSTLWAGPRGGAAMTAACLTLLLQSRCPIWPWHQADETGLLVEAFPAAQLCHWEMSCWGYNGDSQASLETRQSLVAYLSGLIQISDEHRKRLQDSADALDAVVCAFAAIAVSTGRLSRTAMDTIDEEGQIAVHERFPKMGCQASG